MIKVIQSCIDTVVRKLSARDHTREQMTRQLFSALAELAGRSGYEAAYSGGKAGVHEWLYDMVWLKYDDTPRKSLLEVKLALESEWNNGYEEIIRDFNKILQSRAEIKVFVCNKQAFDVANVLANAIAKYPDGDARKYLIAICDFDNSQTPVSFVQFNGTGRRMTESSPDPALRYLNLIKERLAAVKYLLNFEGYWPNKKKGFDNGKNGFYFVFAGERKQTAVGFIASLKRLIYIGTASETAVLACAQERGVNKFEAVCQAGEIPYFSFAEVLGGDLNVCRNALEFIYKPPINARVQLPTKPADRLSFTLAGRVASCLGERQFTV